MRSLVAGLIALVAQIAVPGVLRSAIDNALENRDLNAAAGVDFRCAGLEESAAAGPFDVVIANLTGAVLVRLQCFEGLDLAGQLS